MAKSATTEKEIDVIRAERGIARFAVIGESPLILNRMAEKAKRELLFPKGRKNKTEKATTMKHDPVAEFQASAHRLSAADNPTLLALPATAFKGSLRTAALDMPGAQKSQIGRLTYVEGEYVGIYGRPAMLMSVTRSADMNRTPDVRTRVIVPEWAAFISVAYVMPILREHIVVALLAAAGMTVGVGDWRPEKGAGAYGRFRLASPEDADFKRIVALGRKVQIEAMESPEPYDDETRELFEWFAEEVGRRGRSAEVKA